MIPTMNAPFPPPRELDPVERQALAWVRRVAAGEITHADGAALRQWCQANPAHAAAFAAARARWAQLGEAAAMVKARNPAAIHATLPAARRPSSWQRRAFLGGALGATAATAVAAVVHPPLGLWPAANEWRADYRTATGEQRRLALGGAVDVELNTRTSIAVWPGAGGTRGIALIAGEAAIDLSRAETPFVVAAGAGHTQALQRQAARFEVRHLDGAVCVTCIDGQVQVAHASGTVQLSGGQRLRYDDHTLGRAEQLDAARMPGWRQGYLRFTDAPLGEVLDEINRYRTGKVVLLDRQLAAKPVTGRFQIHALDKAIVQMQRSFGLHARTLPGGMVLLS
jgi:transmembrane sensor